jgi:hypothetical protein
VLGRFVGVPNRHAPAGPPQLFDFERVVFDYVIPVDREAPEQQFAKSGAKAALIVFLTSSTIS